MKNITIYNRNITILFFVEFVRLMFVTLPIATFAYKLEDFLENIGRAGSLLFCIYNVSFGQVVINRSLVVYGPTHHTIRFGIRLACSEVVNILFAMDELKFSDILKARSLIVNQH
jgi:hypothetical protein